MKILLIGDASNFHANLAAGLRALGHDVYIADSRVSEVAVRDFGSLRLGAGKILGGIHYLRWRSLVARDLRGYDVVAVNAPTFLELRPFWLYGLVRALRRQNGALWLTALGTDQAFVRNLTGANPALEFSEYNSPSGLTQWAVTPEAKVDKWLAKPLSRYTDWFYGQLNGAVTALYEYHRVIEAEFPGLPLYYGGIPIKSEPVHTSKATGAKINILLAANPRREGEKGTAILAEMLQQLAHECPNVEVSAPPRCAYAQFLAHLDAADIVADQYYAYTPATTALLAMTRSAVPVTGGNEAFYRFIGEPTLRPSIETDPRDYDATYRRLLQVVRDPQRLNEMKAQGPVFVSRHNDHITVARRFLNAWGVS